MTSLVLHPQHEFAPHVVRTLAMAFAIALNLTALLIALRPLPLAPIALPLPQNDTQAQVLPDTRPLPPPPLPILSPVRHIEHPAPIRSEPRPSPITTPAPTVNTATTSEPSPIAAPVTQSIAPAGPSGSSDATIEYESATPPPYPIAELRAGVQGTVLLRVFVDETGKPVQVVIVKGSGSRALDQAALKHVLASWRFHPAQRDGHAIAAWAQVPVEFKLSGA